MFTGLVDDIGVVDSVAEESAGRNLRVTCRYTDLVPGESVAVNGACLTVREAGAGWFTSAAIVTTLERTTIGHWCAGERVNLERAMRVGDRLGGHLVLGHVDEVAAVCRTQMRGDAWLIELEVTPSTFLLMAPHGSITVDGVSLTVNELLSPNVVQLSIIEFTRQHTTLGALVVGDTVHVEADVLAKHVARLLSPHLASVSHSS